MAALGKAAKVFEVEDKEGAGGQQASASTLGSGRIMKLVMRIKQIQIKRKLLMLRVSQRKTTLSGKVMEPERSSNLNGVLRVLVPMSVVRRRTSQVIIRLAILMMVILVLPVIREFLVISVGFTIMLLRIAVDCSVRFVDSITTLLIPKDAYHGMLDLNCALHK